MPPQLASAVAVMESILSSLFCVLQPSEYAMPVPLMVWPIAVGSTTAPSSSSRDASRGGDEPAIARTALPTAVLACHPNAMGAAAAATAISATADKGLDGSSAPASSSGAIALRCTSRSSSSSGGSSDLLAQPTRCSSVSSSMRPAQAGRRRGSPPSERGPQEQQTGGTPGRLTNRWREP